MFTHGGIGTGSQSQGFPLLMQIVDKISQQFDVTVYSLAPFNSDFKPHYYRAYCVPASIKLNFFRWSYLIFLFVKNTFSIRYHALYSFWGYPTGLVTVLLGKLLNKPSLVNILGAETANLPEINYGYLRSSVIRRLIFFTCKNADKLIAVSGYQVSILRKYGIDREVEIIPWGVDGNFFFPMYKPLDSPLKIIHVANLNEVKDQHTLILAFQLIRRKIPAELKIVGPDFLKGQIQKLVSSMNLQSDVQFIGFVPHKEILKYFQWADAFMLTSLSEGQNNSITEAMMCGILPVGTRVGIMADVGDEVGITVECGDYETLSKSVIELYRLPYEWEKKTKAAYRWASLHDLKWTVQELNRVIENA